MAAMFGGGVYLMMNLNTLAKPRIEKIASEALGVKVSIGDLEVVLKEKYVAASDIRIANPKGFSKPYALTIDTASARLGSLAEKLVKIDSIEIKGTQANLEVKESGTNFTALQKGIKKPDPNAKGGDINVIINKFSMSAPQLNPSVTLIEAQDLDPITIGDVNMSAIGTAEGGLPAGEAVARISKEILKTATNAAGKAGFYQGLSAEALKEMGVSQINVMKEQIGTEINKIGESIKGLFD